MKIEKIVLEEEKNTSLTAYIQDVGGDYRFVTRRPAVLIIPGGAYQYCSDREGEPVAFEYLKAGFQAFVLRYTVKKPWPAPLNDYEKAMEIIKEHALEWNIYADKIVVIGFSAGGHLASCAVTLAKNKPNAGILGYAAIRGADQIIENAPDACEYVDGRTAPCFLFATRTDQLVACQDTLEFSKALADNGVCFETHVYSHGPHGLVTGDPSIENRHILRPENYRNWVNDSIQFLRDVLGCFDTGGLTAPIVRSHLTDDFEEFLSVDCTIARIISNESGKEVIESLMPELNEKYIQWSNGMREKYHTDLDVTPAITTNIFSVLWRMVGNSETELKIIQEKLSKIPNL